VPERKGKSSVDLSSCTNSHSLLPPSYFWTALSSTLKSSVQQHCSNIPHPQPRLVSLGGRVNKTHCRGSWKQLFSSRSLLFITNSLSWEVIQGKILSPPLVQRLSEAAVEDLGRARVLAALCSLVRLQNSTTWEKDNQLQPSPLCSRQSPDSGAAKDSRSQGWVKPITWKLVPKIGCDFLPSYKSRIQAIFSVTKPSPPTSRWSTIPASARCKHLHR